jgi:hypothetical protein
MKFKLLILFLIIIACKQEKRTQTFQDDLFHSKEGNFEVYFPTKPKTQKLDNNMIGIDKISGISYQSIFQNDKIFTIGFTIVPEYILKSWDLQDYYKQGVETIANRYGKDFKLTRNDSINENGLEGRYFYIEVKPEVKIANNVKGYIEGKFFLVGNKYYNILFTGEPTSETDKFFKSFRIKN